MPLKAFVDGEKMLAPFIDSSEWEKLKKAVSAKKAKAVLPCCGADTYLRTSKHGTRHFVHKRGSNECDYKGETWQHLKAKEEILKGCQRAGYEADTEVSRNNWRADVLATTPMGKEIAFEVQWSKQTLEETMQRQEIYARDNVRGCWFFRKPPHELNEYLPASSFYELVPNKKLPLFHLTMDDDKKLTVLLNKKEYPLSRFAEDLLSSRIKFCPIISAHQNIRITFVERVCWRCKDKFFIFCYHRAGFSACGLEIKDDLFYDPKQGFSPKVIKAVWEYIKTPQGNHIRVGTIKKRYSHTERGAYMSFGCPACNAIQGSYFLFEYYGITGYAYEEHPIHLEFEIEEVMDSAENYPYTHHWCYPDLGNSFCCGNRP